MPDAWLFKQVECFGDNVVHIDGDQPSRSPHDPLELSAVIHTPGNRPGIRIDEGGAGAAHFHRLSRWTGDKTNEVSHHTILVGLGATEYRAAGDGGGFDAEIGSMAQGVALGANGRCLGELARRRLMTLCPASWTALNSSTLRLQLAPNGLADYLRQAHSVVDGSLLELLGQRGWQE
jgi:hypothetical protein